MQTITKIHFQGISGQGESVDRKSVIRQGDFINLYSLMTADSSLSENAHFIESYCPLKVVAISSNSLTFEELETGKQFELNINEPFVYSYQGKDSTLTYLGEQPHEIAQ